MEFDFTQMNRNLKETLEGAGFESAIKKLKIKASESMENKFFLKS